MRKKIAFIVFLVVVVGLLVPQEYSMPVEGANKASYHPQSFWYYPWGKSGTHKGVDIFAKEGTAMNSATDGLVVYTGSLELGGNVVVILGPKWRLHYYAHLRDINTTSFSIAKRDKLIGTVGTSGNAKGKPPHLHYSIVSLLPYFWQIDLDRQGWKKMFYLNPIPFLEGQD